MVETKNYYFQNSSSRFYSYAMYKSYCNTVASILMHSVIRLRYKTHMPPNLKFHALEMMHHFHDKSLLLSGCMCVLCYKRQI